ncbi:hypothetical protein V5O48_014245 [Marasmius crinis-equi]|uniref:Uncharacterized protein n=1 Tax=Marasmius crinis-equi TaxID=585013 RepID=A0ABR3EXT3_9AGAR
MSSDNSFFDDIVAKEPDNTELKEAIATILKGGSKNPLDPPPGRSTLRVASSVKNGLSWKLVGSQNTSDFGDGNEPNANGAGIFWSDAEAFWNGSGTLILAITADSATLRRDPDDGSVNTANVIWSGKGRSSSKLVGDHPVTCAQG